jgi:hypothetical protein
MRCVFYFVIVILAAGGCGYGGGGGTQGEVDFAVENLLQAPRYVNWSTMGNGLVACQNGAGECRFHPPGCTDECSEQNLQQDCCLACEMAYPAVKTIDPGDTLMIRWSGKLYPSDWEHCSDCDCYRVEDAAPGGYHAEVCVYTEQQCDFEPCTGPDADGVILGASPAGTPACYGKDFSVPYTKAFLILSIE